MALYARKYGMIIYCKVQFNGNCLWLVPGILCRIFFTLCAFAVVALPLFSLPIFLMVISRSWG